MANLQSYMRKDTYISIENCTFSNNTGDYSVIVIDNGIGYLAHNYIINMSDSTVSHNNMTGITIIKTNDTGILQW